LGGAPLIYIRGNVQVRAGSVRALSEGIGGRLRGVGAHFCFEIDLRLLLLFLFLFGHSVSGTFEIKYINKRN
jgi:hypothetical protein